MFCVVRGGWGISGFAFIPDDWSRRWSNQRVIGGTQGIPHLTQQLGTDTIPTRPDSTMLLFTPDDPCNTSRLFRFLREVNEKHRLTLESYQDLYQWSMSNTDRFWSQVWDHTQIIGNKGNHVVDTTATPGENPAWFSDSALNFAENLLSNRSPDTTAIVQVCTLPSSDVWVEVLGNKLCMQQNRLPRIPSLSSLQYPTHSSTRSWRTRCPGSSGMALFQVIASHHTPPTAS